MGKLAIATYLIPVAIKKSDNNTYEYVKNDGGLMNGLMGVKELTNFMWFGWPGDSIREEDRQQVTEHLRREYNFVPVYVKRATYEDSYLRYCNLFMWAIFNYVLERQDYRQSWWKSYLEVNELYAKRVLEHLEDGDLIWIHDFHLMMLPHFLRKHAKVNLKIGHYVHTNFPTIDIFKYIPQAEEICKSLLLCDLIGFHTANHELNFKNCCHGLLGKDPHNTLVIPFGINLTRFEKLIKSPKSIDYRESLKQKYQHKKVFFGCERADYVKSIDVKLKAFDLFLETNPDMRGNVVFVEVAVPCKLYLQYYLDYAESLRQLSEKINKKYEAYGEVVEFHYEPLQLEHLVALYEHADGCVVSSLMDGLNLIALEYVYAQNFKPIPGVLIVSKFAGIADYFDTEFKINPVDLEDIAQKYRHALDLDEENRRQIQKRLYDVTVQNTADHWTKVFLEKIGFDLIKSV